MDNLASLIRDRDLDAKFDSRYVGRKIVTEREFRNVVNRFSFYQNFALVYLMTNRLVRQMIFDRGVQYQPLAMLFLMFFWSFRPQLGLLELPTIVSMPVFYRIYENYLQ